MNSGFLLSLIFFSWVGFGLQSDQKTDLGDGNSYVMQRFENFKQDNTHCKVRDANSKRVIITGFGSFNEKENLTGRLIEYLAKGRKYKGDSKRVFTYGADIYQKRIRIDGEVLDVCFLRLDVVWDLASAIVIEEMNRFRPESVLMSGIGVDDVVILERGGVNKVKAYHGFTHFGQRLNNNIPRDAEGEIIENGPEKIKFLWDRSKIVRNIESLVKKAGFELSVPAEVRVKNKYICNNLAYSVAAAAEGMQVGLANNNIKLRLTYNDPVTVGFIHLPPLKKWNDADLELWSKTLMGSVP